VHRRGPKKAIISRGTRAGRIKKKQPNRARGRAHGTLQSIDWLLQPSRRIVVPALGRGRICSSCLFDLFRSLQPSCRACLARQRPPVWRSPNLVGLLVHLTVTDCVQEAGTRELCDQPVEVLQLNPTRRSSKKICSKSLKIIKLELWAVQHSAGRRSPLCVEAR